MLKIAQAESRTHELRFNSIFSTAEILTAAEELEASHLVAC